MPLFLFFFSSFLVITFIFRGIHTAGRPFRAPFNCCVDRTLAAAVGFRTANKERVV